MLHIPSPELHHKQHNRQEIITTPEVHRVPGYQDLWISGSLDLWVTEFLGRWIAGPLGLLVAGSLGPLRSWVLGFCVPGFWVSEPLGLCMGLWASECLGLYRWLGSPRTVFQKSNISVGFIKRKTRY